MFTKSTKRHFSFVEATIQYSIQILIAPLVADSGAFGKRGFLPFVSALSECILKKNETSTYIFFR
jgi:hypothetical protein